MQLTKSTILLIGAGKMGGALRAAWLKAGVPEASITIIDPHAPDAAFTSVSEFDGKADCIVLAVKPQMMDEVVGALVEKYAISGTRSLFLSIAAGKTLSYFKRRLPECAVVRAMPNTPAIIGKGISALIANDKVNASQKTLAEALLAAAGKTVWLENEGQMDAVTAVSGSGPAYMFYFLDLLIDAGKAQGLPEEMCKELAIETMIGAAELAKQAPESLTTLRKNVTSPGGTTEAALGVLMKNDALKSLVHKAIWQAAKRAKELG